MRAHGGYVCKAPGCDHELGLPRLMFCPTHWGLLPEPLQRTLWEEYRQAQDGRGRWKLEPTAAWTAAMKQALTILLSKGGGDGQETST